MYHAPGDRRHATTATNNKEYGLASGDIVGNYPSSMVLINGQQFPADPSPHNYSSLIVDSDNNPIASGMIDPLASRPQLPSRGKNGQVPAISTEETIGCAAVNIGTMIDEVFLCTLIDGWDVESAWDKVNVAKLQLQMFFIPSAPNLEADLLPENLQKCEEAVTISEWHNRVFHTGFLSQRGGDTRFWRRRHFKLIGGFLIAFHEESREPRMFMDLSHATRVTDNTRNYGYDSRQKDVSTRASNAARIQANAAGLGKRSANADQHFQQLMVEQPRRRRTHKRNNSDYSRRDSGLQANSPPALNHLLTNHANPDQYRDYASDGEDSSNLDIDDPNLLFHRHQQQHYPRSHNSSSATQNSSGLDSGVYVDPASQQQSQFNSSIQSINASLQHGFSIEFGQAGWVEFYSDSEHEKQQWIRFINGILGRNQKIPHWLVKLQHADLSQKLDMTPRINSSHNRSDDRPTYPTSNPVSAAAAAASNPNKDDSSNISTSNYGSNCRNVNHFSPQQRQFELY